MSIMDMENFAKQKCVQRQKKNIYTFMNKAKKSKKKHAHSTYMMLDKITVTSLFKVDFCQLKQ